MVKKNLEANETKPEASHIQVTNNVDIQVLHKHIFLYTTSQVFGVGKSKNKQFFFFGKKSYAPQGCIYLIKNTVRNIVKY